MSYRPFFKWKQKAFKLNSTVRCWIILFANYGSYEYFIKKKEIKLSYVQSPLKHCLYSKHRKSEGTICHEQFTMVSFWNVNQGSMTESLHFRTSLLTSLNVRLDSAHKRQLIRKSKIILTKFAFKRQPKISITETAYKPLKLPNTGTSNCFGCVRCGTVSSRYRCVVHSGSNCQSSVCICVRSLHTSVSLLKCGLWSTERFHCRRSNVNFYRQIYTHAAPKKSKHIHR